MKRMTFFFFCFLSLLISDRLLAQEGVKQAQENRPFSKNNFFIGTQVPLQFTLGYSYRVSEHFSARAQAGIITKPYKGLLVNSLEAFGMDKHLGKVIKKAFETGTLLGIGANYHFAKNYVGVAGQYIHLQGGGITPADALSVYFKQDFSNFDLAGLPAFEFSMQSNLFNIGAFYGREFRLRNPHLSINVEAGLSKIIASKNSFYSNRPVIDRSPFGRDVYKKLDNEMRNDYWEYGYVPTISFYLFYNL